MNARIDRQARSRVCDAAGPAEWDEQLAQLGREWDIERIIETEAAATGLAGLALAIGVNKRFLIIPGMVAAMMLLHAVHGWYPLLPLLRRAGARTRDEIEKERYALKALRGDFRSVRQPDAERRADAAWRAVQL